MLGLATPGLTAEGVSILGTWNCIDTRNGGEMRANVQIRKNRIFNARMYISMALDELHISAIADYKSRWRLDGNNWYETPINVRILKFEVNGIDQRGSTPAHALRDDLMRPQSGPDEIRLTSLTTLEFLHDGEVTVCQRDSDTSKNS